MKFTDFNLDDRILEGIDHAGFTECMPVQEQTFEHSLQGKDVLVQSQTGSGKTAAFVVTIFNQLLKAEEGKKALIIAPTRELALQIEKDAKILNKGLGFTIGTFYGGVGYKQQEDLLKKGTHVMIGTPGRLIDFMDQKKLPAKDISLLVIDEADRLFDMGFFPDIKKILRFAPKRENRQTMLFSATLSDRVKELASRDMNEPVEILLNPDSMTVDNIAQSLYHVSNDEKISLLLGLLKNDDPKNAIIFTNTKREAEEVAARMEINGYKCEYIIGDLPQSKRLKVIDDLKSGRIRYLVATDVAARGLHVDDLEMVVNYDLPEHIENYVHRIGRTARAGKKGKAITFVCEKFVYSLGAVEDFIEMKIPVDWFDDDYLAEDKSAGIRIARKRTGKDDRPRGQRHPSEGPRKKTTRKKGPQKSSASSHDVRKQDSGSKGQEKKTKQEQPVHEKAGAGSKAGKKPAVQSRAKQDAKNQKHPSSSRSSSPKPKSKKQALDQRLEYYSQKYGENFTVKDQPAKKKKKGVLGRIKHILGK